MKTINRYYCEALATAFFAAGTIVGMILGYYL